MKIRYWILLGFTLLFLLGFSITSLVLQRHIEIQNIEPTLGMIGYAVITIYKGFIILWVVMFFLSILGYFMSKYLVINKEFRIGFKITNVISLFLLILAIIVITLLT